MLLLTPPTAEPVTVDEAKIAARISDTAAFDAVVPGHITVARKMAEHITGLLFMQQTWRIELAEFPNLTDALPIYQATGAAVSYWDGSAWATLDPAAYEFGACGTRTLLAPALYTTWPALPTKAVGPRVRVDLTAGAAAAADVDECVKQYIKAMVTHLIESPGATTASNLQETPLFRELLFGLTVY
jgi:uncharacterized phiE125 gp8 family phage protein